MKQAFMVCAFCAAVTSLSTSAYAGRWEWGCAGTSGDQRIVFNRRELVVTTPQKRLGKIRDLIFADDLATSLSEDQHYEAADENGGLAATMTFTRGEDAKHTITLTETASKTLSHHTAMVCGRDEDTAISRKGYRVEIGGEPSRHIIMQCMEYMLTSRGGRPCINRP
jgi:hypothetical protein